MFEFQKYEKISNFKTKFFKLSYYFMKKNKTKIEKKKKLGRPQTSGRSVEYNQTTFFLWPNHRVYSYSVIRNNGWRGHEDRLRLWLFFYLILYCFYLEVWWRTAAFLMFKMAQIVLKNIKFWDCDEYTAKKPSIHTNSCGMLGIHISYFLSCVLLFPNRND